MQFQHSLYLLLALPLAASLWTWGFRTRWLLGLRVATLALVLLALAGLSLRLPSRAGTVVVVADYAGGDERACDGGRPDGGHAGVAARGIALVMEP